MKLYKYQVNFLLLYSAFGQQVKDKQFMADPLSTQYNQEQALSRIGELERRGFFRYAQKEEVLNSGLKYDGRKSYFTIGEKGWKFLKSLEIKSKDDLRIDALLAKELLRRE